VITAPLLGLAFLGTSRWRRLGAIVASILIVLFGYMLAATYVGKLIPLYAGYEGPTSLTALVQLYGHRLAEITENLAAVTLAPIGLIYALAAVVVLMAAAQPVLVRFLNGIHILRTSCGDSSS
jgi:hypothetical protein